MTAHADYIPQRLMFDFGFWPGPDTFYERGPGTYPKYWFMFANLRCPAKIYIKFDPTGDALQTFVEDG